MKVTLLNSENLGAFVARIDALRPESKRLWGSLEVPAMVAHLNWVIDVSLGEVQVEDKNSFFARQIGARVVFTDGLKWPKVKIKAPPHFTPTTKNTLDEERARLIPRAKTFRRKPRNANRNRKTIHPLFGPLTLKHWQRAHGKHMNHHCEQFGV